MVPAEVPGRTQGEPSAVTLRIEVVVGVAPRQPVRVALSLPPASTVREALAAAQVGELVSALGPECIEATLAAGDWSLGVWGRKERLAHVLRDQDRIELVRALKVDPKEARRLRYRAQGEKLPKGFHRPKGR